VQADGATHANFPTASVFAVSPCNGEGVLLSGPLDVIFHANQNGAGVHVNINSTFHGTGTGDQGNDYVVPAVGGDQFDVATADGTYIIPFHAEVISTGAAPNYAVEGTDTVIVLGG